MVPVQPSRFLASALLATLGFTAISASAQLTNTNTWSGTNSGTWSDGGNWSGGVPSPGEGLLLRFLGDTNYFSTNDLGAPFTLTGLHFNNTGAATNGNAVNLSGGQLLFTNAGGVGAFISNQGPSAVIIDNNINIASSSLTLHGNGGLVTLNGVLSGTGSLIKSGNHTNTLTSDLNSFSGGVVLNAGRLVVTPGVNNSTILGSGSSVTMNGGTLAIMHDLADPTLGSGSGYSFAVNGNSTLDVRRLTTNGVNTITHFNTLSVGSNAQFSLTGANNYDVRFTGLTTIGGTNSRFNVSSADLILDGGVTDGGGGYALQKLGGAVLFLTNFTAQSYSGGTVIGAGTLQVWASSNDFASVLGTGSTITMNGGTLQLRTLTNNAQVIGPGAGYNLVVGGNSTIDVNRILGASQNGLGILGSITNLGAQLTVTGGNNYNWAVDGGVEVNGFSSFNVANGRSANPFSFLISGPITEGSAGATFRKTGSQSLGYTNPAAPTHTGGTVIDNGQLIWRPLGLAAGNYGFGTGPITIDGGGEFHFQNNTTADFAITNDIIVANRVNLLGGIRDNGGGELNTARNAANSPRVTFTGALELGGQLSLNGGTVGSATPLTLANTITLMDDDRPIYILGSGTGTDNRVVISGNITSDSTPRTLTLIANNHAGVRLTGTNSGLAAIVIKPSFQGSTGRVRLESPDALPAGQVTVMDNAFLGLVLTNFASANISELSNKFNLQSGAVLGVEGYGGAAGTSLTSTNSIILDLSATGLNRDIRLGASTNFNVRLNGAITPFSTSYKLGGGGGTVTIVGNNRLTDDGVTPRRLLAGPSPFDDPIGVVSPGAVTLNGTNSYSGGTIVQSGTLTLNTSNTIGSGELRIYGFVNVTGGNARLIEPTGVSNINEIILQPGGTLQLDNAGSTTAGLNRFGDQQPLAIGPGRLNISGRNVASFVTTEFIGDTTFGRGAIMSINGSISNEASLTLSVNTLDRAPGVPGTLEITHTTNSAGVERGNLGDLNRLIVASNAPTPVNGLTTPYIVNNSRASHVTYDGVNGFTNVTYTSGDVTAAGGTDLVDQTSAATLASDTTVYAYRQRNNLLLNGSGIKLIITSGGLISSNNNGIAADLVFGSVGTPGEGLLYVNNTMTNLGNITASSITKFGGGNLVLNNTSQTYSNGWDVNRGSMTVIGTVAAGETNFGLGTGGAGNFVNLNGGATLNFQGVGTNIVYASGKIVSLDNNAITANSGNQDSRVQFIAPLGIDMNAYSNGPLGSFLRIDQNRSRAVTVVAGPVTLNANSTFNIRNTQNLTGGSNRVVFGGGLIADGKTLTKQGNGTLVLNTDNIATFTNSTINVVGGVLNIGANGSLGAAGNVVNINPGTVLEIQDDVVNSSPLATVNQFAGSAERWQGALNRFSDLASVQTYTVPSNVNLQVAVNLTGLENKTIQLTGGSIVGYNYIDDSRPNNIFIPDTVKIELLADSKIGQGDLDNGRAGTIFSNNAYITGTFSLTKIGLDTVQLGNNSNDWTGGTIVKEGQLRLGVANALPNSTLLNVDRQATFNLNNFNQTIGGLTGTGLVTNSGGGGAETLTINGSGTNTFSGLIGGTMAVTKAGTGTQIVTGANTYTGRTIINGGTFFVANTSGSATGPGGVTINAGGTLAGTGSVGGIVTNVGGTLSPGGSTGILTVDAYQSLVGGTDFFELNGITAGVGYDQLVVLGSGTNAVDLAGMLSLSLGYTPTVGDSFTIINNLSTNSVLGNYAGLIEGTTLTNSGFEFLISYIGGTGNDVVLTVVPEPSQVALMLFGGVMAGWVIARRRR